MDDNLAASGISQDALEFVVFVGHVVLQKGDDVIMMVVECCCYIKQIIKSVCLKAGNMGCLFVQGTEGNPGISTSSLFITTWSKYFTGHADIANCCSLRNGKRTELGFKVSSNSGLIVPFLDGNEGSVCLGT